MASTIFNRRKVVGGMASIFGALGAGSMLAGSAVAKSKSAGVQKMGRDGKPSDRNDFITPLIVHNGLIYIAGQGANSNGPVGKDDLDSHTTKVLDNVKELVEAGGGSMASILQLTVYLADIAYFEDMNKIFKTYFPNGGPARTT